MAGKSASDDTDETVFEHRELLDPAYIPDKHRIVGRDSEIAYLTDAMTPIMFSQNPDDVVVCGPSGAGKTLCASFVTERTVRNAEEQGATAEWVSLSALRSPSVTDVIRGIAAELNDSGETGITFPERGLSVNQHRDRLRRLLDERYDAVIVHLDELQLFDDDVLEVVESLSASLSECDIGIVGLTTASPTHPRAERAGWDEVFTYEAYSREVLSGIVDRRMDAFVDGAVDDDVQRAVVNCAAEPVPDARHAIEVLRAAGVVAEDAGRTHADASHVKRARDVAVRDEIGQRIESCPKHSLYVLLAAYRLDSGGETGVESRRIYERYEEICRQHELEPLVVRRIRDYLNRHVDIGLLDRTVTHGGRGEGSYGVYEPAVDVQCAIAAIEEALDTRN